VQFILQYRLQQLSKGLSVKKVTVNTYRKDKFYSSVVIAVGKLLTRGDVFTPIDVLIEMGRLSNLEKAYSRKYFWNRSLEKKMKNISINEHSLLQGSKLLEGQETV
jgi:hypothetical protein